MHIAGAVEVCMGAAFAVLWGGLAGLFLEEVCNSSGNKSLSLSF
jgi:hypothetical protein